MREAEMEPRFGVIRNLRTAMLIPGEHPITRLYVRLSRQDVPQQCVGEKILSTVTLEDERPEPMPFLRAKHFLERGVQLGCVGRG
jgi:hypothetical protein